MRLPMLPPLTTCRWTKSRLALFAGDDLGFRERRKVERHLIGCTSCRARQAAFAESLQALHAASATLPSPTVTQSLWPALENQIRRSRHEQRSTPFVSYALAASLILGLGLVVVGSLPSKNPTLEQVRSNQTSRPALPPDDLQNAVVAKSTRPASANPPDEPGRAQADPQRSY